MPTNLTIQLPDEDVPALQAKATAPGVLAEQYALQVLEQDLAPEWLRQSRTCAREAGVDQLSMDEIDAEIAAARKTRREAKPQSDALSGL
jgi:plasmid stability protein